MTNTPPASDDWRELDRLFAAALERPRAARAAFLDAACAGRPALRGQLEDLLAAAAQADAWIERSADLVGHAAAEILRHRGVAGGSSDAGQGGGGATDCTGVDAGERADLEPGRRVGAYRIVRRVARGGMGTVYLATRADGHFEQQVAVKLLRRGLDTDDIVARFRAERQILAALVHPNIGRLLDGGATDDGRPFLVLEYVDGESITDYCDARRLSVASRITLFTEVCRAVQHAHDNRVLHRDLKPSNILVARDGRVKLLDFGVAKLLGEAPDRPHTRTGQWLLTPEYASPEQLAGAPVTAASDVYQLGVLLHVLLTGVRPRARGEAAAARGESVPASPSARVSRGADARAEADIAAARGTDPRRLARALRGDLDAIVLKALRVEPEERYGSVAELVADLQRHQAQRVVLARRGTIGYRARRLLRRNRPAIAAAAAGVVIAGLAAAGSLAYTAERPGVVTPLADARALAVGEIRGYDDATATWTSAVRDMLATSLSGVAGIDVLSPTRMAELVVVAQASGDSASALRRAAMAGGATALLEGGLRTTGERYRLDLRWVDLGSGRVRRALSVEAGGAFELAERATIALAAAAGLAAPASPASPQTRSSAAFRFYEEGMRAYHRGDGVTARSFLHAAVDEDSTFALASLFLGLATPEHAPSTAHLNRALRFADGAGERDRLFIQAIWAREFWEPSLAEFADSLVRLYPSEPEGHYLLGRARLTEGDFAGAIRHFERVVTMDSLGLAAGIAQCRACDALAEMVDAWIYADSFPAAEDVARRWVRLQPTSARAWRILGWVLWRQDRFDESAEARRRTGELRVGDSTDELYPATSAIRAGDFATADERIADRLRYGSPPVRRRALFWQTVSLRHQGRLHEALQSARAYRAAAPAGISDLSAGELTAQVLLELGRYDEAAALFDSISVQPWSELTPARNASRRMRGLTQVATARAASGDVDALAELVDLTAELGEQSGLAIYRRMQHYPRGLLLAANGRHEDAAAQFRKAIFAPAASVPVPKLALARSLLALDRPAEAVAVLQATLRGPIAGTGIFTTRTEVLELLGHAWEAAGRPDSAAVHFGKAYAALANADPELHPRRDALRQRIGLAAPR